MKRWMISTWVVAMALAGCGDRNRNAECARLATGAESVRIRAERRDIVHTVTTSGGTVLRADNVIAVPVAAVTRRDPARAEEPARGVVDVQEVKMGSICMNGHCGDFVPQAGLAERKFDFRRDPLDAANVGENRAVGAINVEEVKTGDIIFCFGSGCYDKNEPVDDKFFNQVARGEIPPLTERHFDFRPAFVRRVGSDGAETETQVVLGVSDGEFVEIKSGLAEGDMVAFNPAH